jgi:aquaporin Z
MANFSSQGVLPQGILPPDLAETKPLREKWGWMVAFGVFLALAGFVALGSVVTATVVSVLVVGVAMIISGFGEIFYAFAMRSWKKFFLWILLGILYVIAGFSVFENPLLAASFLTLILGAGLFASGLVRTFLAFQLPKDSPWAVVGMSGLVTLLLGLIILIKWPVSSLWVIGAFLGVDLIFAGFSWIGVGLSLNRGRQPAAATPGADDPNGLGKKLLAEFLGTFWLVFGGCGSAVISAAYPQLGIGFTGVALAFGLSVLTGAYAFGPISGGHFNPAVSLGLAVAGRLPLKDLAPYVIAQVVGATAAAGVLFIVASGNIDFSLAAGFAANGYDEHSPAGYTLRSGFVVETVLTAFFLLVILGATEKRVPIGFAPIAIGLALTLIHLVDIPITNASVNPARSTSQALFVGGWALEQLWLFWVAPPLGGLLGGLIHRLMLSEKLELASAPAIERQQTAASQHP